MKFRWFLITAVVFALAVPSAMAGNAYVGADSCKMCHKSKAKGDQYGKWKESKHSKAFEVLASEEAKKIAKEKGIADPQKDGKCLKCHVAGYAADATLHTKKWNQEEGVSCEACHGPGSAYMKKETMKDQAKAIAAGLVLPEQKVCEGCHNSESPTFKSFNFDEAKKKIEHPNPKKGQDTGDDAEEK